MRIGRRLLLVSLLLVAVISCAVTRQSSVSPKVPPAHARYARDYIRGRHRAERDIQRGRACWMGGFGLMLHPAVDEVSGLPVGSVGCIGDEGTPAHVAGYNDRVLRYRRQTGHWPPHREVVIPMESARITLQHRPGDQVVEALRAFYPEVKVAVEADRRTLVLKGPRWDMQDVRDVVRLLDVSPQARPSPTPAPSPSARPSPAASPP